MKLEIVSGQSEINLNDIFTKILNNNDIYVGDIKQKNFMIYPEDRIKHPKKLYDTMKQVVKEHIESNEDLFILTYSDHVLNAVRVEIKNHNFEGGKCHQFQNNGYDVCATILNDGRLTHWVNDIFDVWDTALTELL